MWQLAASLWHDLSAAEQAAWERDATPRGMTGYAWYMSQALRPNPGIYLPLAGGAMTGIIDMSGNQVHGLPAPVHVNDAARMAYVDAKVREEVTRPGARARRTTHQTIGTGGPYTAIIFDITDFDNDSIWNVANPTRLTINTAGIYLFLAQTRWPAHAAGYRSMYIEHSTAGVLVQEMTQQADANNIWRGHTASTWDCLEDDFVELKVYQNTGADLDCQATGNQTPVLSAVRIG